MYRVSSSRIVSEIWYGEVVKCNEYIAEYCHLRAVSRHWNTRSVEYCHNNPLRQP
uniref:Uncharacterized protein n=1 Tax=Onchocerca volvulus TaxID=6282 RepID=A0A8R1Y4S4_ONCVO